MLELSASEAPRHPVRSYSFAVAAVAAAYLVRLALGSVLQDRAPFLLFVLPVVASTVVGGRSAGLLAGALSLLAGFSFEQRTEWFGAVFLTHAATFVCVCGAIGWIGSRLALERAAADLAKLKAEREATNARLASEQFHLLLESATTYAIMMLDRAGNISTWNKGAERIFGWSQADVLGRHCCIFYPATGDERERADTDLQGAAQQRGRSEEMWQVRADGSEFLADVTTSPVIGPDGDPNGFARVVHDVTERRASEVALARRERHLHSILATVPDAMVVIDPVGAILSFSTTAERLFGYSEADVLGKNVKILMPNPDRDQHDDYIRRYMETGVPRVIGTGRVVTGLRSDGSTFPMKLSVGEAVVDEQRIFTGFIQDLTETRNFEARLDQLNSELIHVSRLSAMGTMASTLAHELNQPLTAISNYGEAAGSLLEDDNALDRDSLREAVSEMAEQALRAGAIVRRLRDFVARGEVNKTVEDLPKLINEAAALALVGTREKGVESHFDFDPAATPVIADRVQIQQVLVNLMRNAIEAMDAACEQRLSVTTRRAAEQMVEISVTDSGHGIAPGMEARLFQAFSSTKDSGMGLGLSICRTIVEAHGGRIAAGAAEGGGTTFRFTLPLADSASA